MGSGKMENSNTACPVCTLFLREGVTLQAHLDTHPKEQVIEALLKVSSGGSAAQSSVASSSNNSNVSVQRITNSNTSIISQPPPPLFSIDPQSQMTTAVAYQHFMTGNGSAILPQYIQVPIVNPSGNIPVLSNSTNLVPNHTVNYSQTAYNPLYNPYIPQPYPFTQPVFTGFPISALPIIDSNLHTRDSNLLNNQSESVLQSNVLVKKCNVATSTDISKRNSKVKCKKTFLKKVTTHHKVKIFNQKPNESTCLVGKTKFGTTEASDIKTTKLKLAVASSSTNTETISPPPLTPKNGTTNCISSSKTPSPPPLAKAPHFEITSSEKDKKITNSGGSSVKTNCINNNEVSFMDQNQKSKSVIEEPDNVKKCSNNEISFVDQNHKPTSIVKEVDKIIECSSNEIRGSENQNEIRMLSESVNIKKLPKNPATFNKNTKGGNEIDKKEKKEEKEKQNKGKKEEKFEEKQKKIFEIFEITEDNKIDITNTATNQDIPKEINSANIEKNCDGSEIFIQQENIFFSENSPRKRTNDNFYSEFIDVQRYESIKNNNRDENQNEYRFYNEVVENDGIENLNAERMDSQLVTYTDLQPAKSSRLFQDLDISPYLNVGNYMEVDGIKIFFNEDTANLPLDPVLKVANVQSSNGNASTIMKTEENQVNNHSSVDSVIQIVSSDSESKNDLVFKENYTTTTSQVNNIQLSLPDLSPLALNIQTDESMPARGELSEQESLGAENSSWNIFHLFKTNDTKTLEEWGNDIESVSVIGDKKSSKSFKCSICSEVFSCPKERRVHKNTVHLNKTDKAEKCSLKKQKTYVCITCNEVFTSLKDRKTHVFQSHCPDLKNKKSNQLKKENAESVNMSETAVKNEGVQDNNVKTEQSATPRNMGSRCIKYCSRCNLHYLGLKKFREHLRLVHGEIRYKCESCSACFDEEDEYNRHLLIHPLTCDKCGKVFHKKPNLNLHVKRHLGIKPHECSLCPKGFVTLQKLKEHMNTHSGKKPLKCAFCDKTFRRHSNLAQHKRVHHVNVKKKIKDFVCRCGEVFHSLRKLEWHKEVHDPKPKACPFCPEKFIHRTSLTRHIRKAHLPEYLPGENREFDNVQCPICEKIYLRSSLVVHMRVHNGEKPHTCKICNKQFSTKWNLELHNWTHQSRSSMPFKCTICKRAFAREPDYAAHVNSHRNYKPFTCNVCGQKFMRKYTCLRHQEEHKKNKQYVCGVNGCAKSFHRGYYLRDHMKVHTGVRPHTCHICGKASSTKSNHNKHVRIHDTREPVNTES